MVQSNTTETHMFVKIYWVPELLTGDNVTILIFKQKGVGKYRKISKNSDTWKFAVITLKLNKVALP